MTEWTPAALPGLSYWFDAGDARCYAIERWEDRSGNGRHLVPAVEIISKHDQPDIPPCYFRITDQGGRIGRIIWDNAAGAIGWEGSWPKNRERIEFYLAKKHGIELRPSHIGSRFSWPPKWPQG
jgi:hypothetical protein